MHLYKLPYFLLFKRQSYYPCLALFESLFWCETNYCAELMALWFCVWILTIQPCNRAKHSIYLCINNSWPSRRRRRFDGWHVAFCHPSRILLKLQLKRMMKRDDISSQNAPITSLFLHFYPSLSLSFSFSLALLDICHRKQPKQRLNGVSVALLTAATSS